MNGGDFQQQRQQQQQQMMMQQWYAQQQHWMGMQYPQPMIYGGTHYVPYYHGMHPMHPMYAAQQQQQQRHGQIHGAAEENVTLWIGDLQPWMDEGYLQSCFSQAGEVISVKIIRNKHTGQSERYGFVEFNSHSTAETVLQSLSSTTMPDTDQPLRLNWASFNSGDRHSEAVSDPSIFVGDLAAEVTDETLHDTFVGKYPSVKGAKVVIDSNTGRSKGYGFVRFGDEDEKNRAMAEMNGEDCLGRPMKVGAATPKRFSSHQQFSASQGQSSANSDSSNTTIFVGGLDAEVSDDELKESFAPFGEVVSVKIPNGKRCGFVQFANRNEAEEAIEKLNGTVIGKQTVRLSWGRNPGNRQSRWNGAGSYYGGRQQAYYSNGHGNGYYEAAADAAATSNGHE